MLGLGTPRSTPRKRIRADAVSHTPPDAGMEMTPISSMKRPRPSPEVGSRLTPVEDVKPAAVPGLLVGWGPHPPTKPVISSTRSAPAVVVCPVDPEAPLMLRAGSAPMPTPPSLVAEASSGTRWPTLEAVTSLFSPGAASLFSPAKRPTKSPRRAASALRSSPRFAAARPEPSPFQRPSTQPQPGAIQPRPELRPEGPCERRHGCEHWLALCGAAEARRQQPALYAQLCAAPPPAADVVEQVELDLARTELGGRMLGGATVGKSTEHDELELVQHVDDESAGVLAERQEALRRVLHAFARHDSLTGYVQGMGDIAAQGLLSAYELGEAAEEAAFWWLVHVTGTLLRGFFSEGMAAVWVELGVLSRSLHDMRPQLARHLEAVGCDLACLAPSWYLTLFQRVLNPSESSAALAHLAAGKITPTHLALGILLASEEQLLVSNGLEGVTRELGSMNCGVSRTVGPGVLRAAALVAERWPADALSRLREKAEQEVAEREAAIAEARAARVTQRAQEADAETARGYKSSTRAALEDVSAEHLAVENGEQPARKRRRSDAS